MEKRSMNSQPSSGRSRKRRKKKRDPHAPKPVKTSYLYYVAKNRPILMLERPNASFKEVAQLIGTQWRLLSKQERAPYDHLAERDRERYEREINVYKSKKCNELLQPQQVNNDKMSTPTPKEGGGDMHTDHTGVPQSTAVPVSSNSKESGVLGVVVSSGTSQTNNVVAQPPLVQAQQPKCLGMAMYPYMSVLPFLPRSVVATCSKPAQRTLEASYRSAFEKYRK